MGWQFYKAFENILTPLLTSIANAICNIRAMAIENTVLASFDPRSSIFKSVFDCAYPVYTCSYFQDSTWAGWI